MRILNGLFAGKRSQALKFQSEIAKQHKYITKVIESCKSSKNKEKILDNVGNKWLLNIALNWKSMLIREKKRQGIHYYINKDIITSADWFINDLIDKVKTAMNEDYEPSNKVGF